MNENLLENTRVYLAGAVEHDKGAKSWREQITERLEPFYVQVYDPLVKPSWLPEICKKDPALYRPALAGNNSELSKQDVYDANVDVRKLCLAHVAAADWIICYMPIKYTAGTFEELYLARQLNKPVFFMIPDGVPSTWLLPLFTTPDNQDKVFFNGWDAMFSHLTRLNDGEVALNPYQWVSVMYPKGVEAARRNKVNV
jgi:hypothetical protein